MQFRFETKQNEIYRVRRYRRQRCGDKTIVLRKQLRKKIICVLSDYQRSLSAPLRRHVRALSRSQTTFVLNVYFDHLFSPLESVTRI
jgi:hypothetical protein